MTPIGTISAYSGFLFNPHVEGDYEHFQNDVPKSMYELGVRNVKSIAQRGWIKCDGGKLLIDFSAPPNELFQTIKFAWGGHLEGKFFRAPDLRGLFPRGRDGRGLGFPRDPDANDRFSLWPGGNNQGIGSAQFDMVGPHEHKVRAKNPGPGDGPAHSTAHATHAGDGLIENKSGVGNETRPANVYVEWIVKFSDGPIDLTAIYHPNQTLSAGPWPKDSSTQSTG